MHANSLAGFTAELDPPRVGSLTFSVPTQVVRVPVPQLHRAVEAAGRMVPDECDAADVQFPPGLFHPQTVKHMKRLTLSKRTFRFANPRTVVQFDRRPKSIGIGYDGQIRVGLDRGAVAGGNEDLVGYPFHLGNAEQTELMTLQLRRLYEQEYRSVSYDSSVRLRTSRVRDRLRCRLRRWRQRTAPCASPPPCRSPHHPCRR
jgi:hypothetical protein